MSTFDENRYKDKHRRKKGYEAKIIKFRERIETIEKHINK